MKLTEDIRWKIFEICKAENLDRIERGIVNKGLNVIKKQTKSNLRASFPAAFHKSPYYTDTISEGVMSSVQPRGQEMLGKVHVLGKKTTTSQTYKLRFFEGGTKERYKKTGEYAGKIEARNFFSNAVESTSNDVENAMQDEFEKQMNKILH